MAKYSINAQTTSASDESFPPVAPQCERCRKIDSASRKFKASTEEEGDAYAFGFFDGIEQSVSDSFKSGTISAMYVRLTDEDFRNALRSCSPKTAEILRANWILAKEFAKAVEKAFMEKNHG